MRVIEERFWDKVDWDNDDTERCWPWLAGKCHGYGRFGFVLADGSSYVGDAHRLAYEFVMGDAPDGIVDHRCHGPACKLVDDCPHRACQNPYHMTVGTQADNGARGRVWRWQSDRTHCPRGHEYSEENIYLYRGRRHCRECRRIVDRARGPRNRAGRRCE